MPFSLLPRQRSDLKTWDLAPLLRRCRSLKHLLQVHAFMLAGGLIGSDNASLLGDLIGAASSLGFSDYARLVFAHKPNPCIRLSNAVINSLGKAGFSEEAVLEFRKIRVAGLRPDSYSFPFALRAAIRLPGIEPGRQVHCQAIRDGVDADVHVATALVQFYSAKARISDARIVFDEISSSGFLPLWNAMIAGFLMAKEADLAAEFFERMPARDVISWTTLIAGFSQLNRPKEAIGIFRRMQLEDLKPDEITISALLSVCAEIGALELGEWARSYVHKNRLRWTIPITNALINMYAKCGRIDEAVWIFENMKSKNVISWTAIISGLAVNGMGKEALEMFNRMERSQVSPNDVTFIAVLTGCCHSGVVETGFQVFEMMGSKYSIQPKIEHYGCMIDLLGRGGHLREAEEMLKNMPFEANAATWGSLLAAARTHGNKKLGERAVKELGRLEPENSGNFLLMCNLYADLGRWKDSGMVRKELRDSGTKKQRAWSSIEVDGEVHEFVAEDGFHEQSKIIYDVLLEINEHLRDTKVEVNDEFN